MNFRISSALKNIIGRDLITDDFIAIFELVKNSYDAGAKNVTITFDGNKIIISDDGKGMSKEDIEEKWLFVAYSAKKDGSEDFRDKAQKRKHYAGAKGIGRFSCDRLGNKLIMKTKTSHCSSLNILNVDWSNFERDSKDEFIDIKTDYQTGSGESLKHGTILEISEINNEGSWDDKKLDTLKTSLEKLLNPFESLNQEQEFSIRLICSHEKLDTVIENQVFKKLNLKTIQIISEINPNYIITELIDRGTPLYKIKEKNKKFSKLDSVKIHLFHLNRSAKVNFTRLMKTEPVNFGSVFVFKNGFRVAPFGEPGEDTLGIDQRKAQGYARYLGSRDLMGSIQIWSENENDFKEVSSRDSGLVKTQAYSELENYFFKTLRLFEKYVTGIAWTLEKEKEPSEDLKYIETLEGKEKIIEMLSLVTKANDIELLEYNKDFLNILDSKLNSQKSEILDKLQVIAETKGDGEYSKEIAEISKKVANLTKQKLQAEENALKADEAREAIEKKIIKVKEDLELAEDKVEEVVAEKEVVLKAYEEEKSRSLFLTKSTHRDKDDLENFIHQIKMYASNNKTKINTTIAKIDRGMLTDLGKIKDVLTELLSSTEKILVTSKLATSADFRLNSGVITEDLFIFIKSYLEEIVPLYQDKIKILITETKINEFSLTFSPIKMGMVLDNLISNATKANATKISFDISITEDIFNMNIFDNGDGLNNSILENKRIFEKGFSRTNGSGLGLYFCSTYLKEMKGEISLIESTDKQGLIFNIRVNK